MHDRALPRDVSTTPAFGPSRNVSLLISTGTSLRKKINKFTCFQLPSICNLTSSFGARPTAIEKRPQDLQAANHHRTPNYCISISLHLPDSDHQKTPQASFKTCMHSICNKSANRMFHSSQDSIYLTNPEL